ncbi:hypothetical protein WMF26_36980 [Sorangium sp. So ce185]|uniref:hypothetical protein n=1 Tax=Sorangium sp. So ce185 TaxID=3133287 RepID=UPI003F5E537A
MTKPMNRRHVPSDSPTRGPFLTAWMIFMAFGEAARLFACYMITRGDGPTPWFNAVHAVASLLCVVLAWRWKAIGVTGYIILALANLFYQMALVQPLGGLGSVVLAAGLWLAVRNKWAAFTT